MYKIGLSTQDIREIFNPPFESERKPKQKVGNKPSKAFDVGKQLIIDGQLDRNEPVRKKEKAVNTKLKEMGEKPVSTSKIQKINPI